ncbi:hypothetical protein BN863_28820 [Formosa agariphila KMM 3901]|uniref:Uncharacterized protein n=1 Tax=Formosa agariphila (strain DSM 15362 / KCTC 12365 / LMG 23005 / KMM 3901 / M-2Alg 35-1) TaxID=1347342 RepID=T2KRF3_FORAG|nr:hypothetical protein [Formosa agariphila]CDF80594.1 hypothetical protein BN863_28820 [Formosa agariphila KMM 3901]
MSKTIKIKGSIKMYFNQQIEVTEEQFERLKNLGVEDVYSGDNYELFHEIEGLIDMADMYGIDDTFEDVEVTDKTDEYA